jgi:hypothetical protein
VIHHIRPYGDAPAGSQVFVDRIFKAFTAARKAARIPDVGPDGKRAPTFHEIRSLSKRLNLKQGGVDTKELIGGDLDEDEVPVEVNATDGVVDTKALLGHKSDSAAALYADPRDASPIEIRLSK